MTFHSCRNFGFKIQALRTTDYVILLSFDGKSKQNKFENHVKKFRENIVCKQKLVLF